MQLYTLKSAAERLAVTRKTLYALHAKGQLEFVKIGAATRIAKDELERFVKANADGTRRTSAEPTEQKAQAEWGARMTGEEIGIGEAIQRAVEDPGL